MNFCKFRTKKVERRQSFTFIYSSKANWNMFYSVGFFSTFKWNILVSFKLGVSGLDWNSKWTFDCIDFRGSCAWWIHQTKGFFTLYFASWPHIFNVEILIHFESILKLSPLPWYVREQTCFHAICIHTQPKIIATEQQLNKTTRASRYPMANLSHQSRSSLIKLDKTNFVDFAIDSTQTL